ncbi:MAG TPA: class I SAM-dependent RNA methyltransferase [Pyrinomonadaceae bacterium]|nr:class I SAM-dependent RNA methyltransferase [Pyrinomonadaceae bacterium]
MKRTRRTRRREQGAAGTEAAHHGAQAEVEIERILPGGLGLAHAGGQTLLVALAAPGDRVRVRVERVRGSVAFASITEVLAPSSSRVEPPCPYFGRCGGCDFQQLTYDAQLDAKVEIIRDCLRRVARIEPPPEILITPSPSAWRYRSRLRWQYDARRKHLGYYERGSHRICDVVECPVALPPMQEKLSALRARMREGELPEDASEFEAVAGDEGVSLLPPVAHGDDAGQVRVVAQERYHFDAACFFQINHELLEPLVAEATRGAEGASALDLYCGVGLFTLPLARRFARVTGVEGNAAACVYARRNLADAGLDNATVETSAVGDWLTKHAGRSAPADFVLLDPPRAGAEPETVAAILALRPQHISYVSCDPATLARDLRGLIAGGYLIASLRAFDMFPQTHHVETVVRLARSS